MPETKILTLRLDVDLLTRLRLAAEADSRTMASLIRLALKEYLKTKNV